MKKVLKIIGVLLVLVIIAVAGIASYVTFALPNVGPAPDLKVLVTPEKVKRGEYLANHVMVCMDCHSQRDWSAFAGPMIEGTLGKGGDAFDRNMGFPGTYYAPNITPAGLGSWSDGEIFRAITAGVRKNGKAIFPVMPHTSYGKIDENDIKAVIAYLRTLPSISNRVPDSKSDFPMNFIIHTIPQKPDFHAMPETTDSIRYGQYLFTAAACADCHTPVENGSPITSLTLAGGREFVLPAGMVRSANITADVNTGIGAWNREAFIQRFKKYNDSALQHARVLPTDFNSPMPWTMYAGMTEQDLSAIYAYLKTTRPISHAVVKFSPAAKQDGEGQ